MLGCRREFITERAQGWQLGQLRRISKVERKKKKKQIKPKESREITDSQGKKEGGLLAGNDKAEGILGGGSLSVARSEPWSQISGNKVPYFEDITHKSVILRVQ